MEKIYKKEIQRLMPLFQAISEGKTIQWNDMGVWRDIDGDDEGFFLDTFVGKTVDYRIKPEPKCRPFKDAEECWQEMQKHQPFGWVKTKDKGIIRCMSGLNQKSAFTQVGYKYDEAFDEFIFADGFPFVVKVEE